MTWDNFKVETFEPAGAQINEGLRVYMRKVYAYMAGGLGVSALCAFLGSKPPLMYFFHRVTETGALAPTWFGIISLFTIIAMIFMFHSAIGKLDVQKAQTIFWCFVALLGFSLSNIILVYSGASLFSTFLVTSGAFAGLSLYGYTTQKDLTPWRSFLVMGVVGLFLVILVNLFLQNSALNYALSAIGVFVFAGMTAVDTQRIRQLYNDANTQEMVQALAISGALSLFLDFINLMQFLLTFMGDSRE